MTKTKIFHVPVTEQEFLKFESAAKAYDLSAAEWARRILFKAAEKDLGSDMKLDPKPALARLISVNAPVDDIKVMKEQSIKGRLK